MIDPADDGSRATARTLLRRLLAAGSDDRGSARATQRHVLDRVCDLAVAQLDASAATVTLLPAVEALVVAGASGELAREREQAQFDLGEGPTCEADRTQLAVIAVDMGAEAGRRWPGLVGDVRWADVAAVFAIPLRLGASRFGAMTLYRDRPGRLGAEAMMTLFVLGDLVVELLIDTHPRERGDAAVGHDAVDLGVLLNEELDGQAVVHQAQGMVAVQLGCGLAEALARMRGRAYAEGLTLGALSHRVVDGTTAFTEGTRP